MAISKILSNQIYSLKIKEKIGDSFIFIKLNNQTVKIPVNNSMFISTKKEPINYKKSAFFIGGYLLKIKKSYKKLFPIFNQVKNYSSFFFNGCIKNVNIFLKLYQFFFYYYY